MKGIANIIPRKLYRLTNLSLAASVNKYTSSLEDENKVGRRIIHIPLECGDIPKYFSVLRDIEVI